MDSSFSSVQVLLQASVKRDLRCIPELIYAIEQFEKELIKLGKKIKVIYFLVQPPHVNHMTP